MSNQDSKDWGGKEITEAFFDFLNFTRQSINFNLFGNKEPKYVWDSVFSGELTTSDMDGLISHAFSNHVKVLVAFSEVVRQEMYDVHKYEQQQQNKSNSLNMKAVDALHSIAEKEHNLLSTIKAINEKIDNATDIKKQGLSCFMN